MSNGEKAKSPSYKKLARKLRKLQRQVARQPKDSQRRNVTRIKIAKLHNRIADTRKDFLHKLSTKSSQRKPSDYSGRFERVRNAKESETFKGD